MIRAAHAVSGVAPITVNVFKASPPTLMSDETSSTSTDGAYTLSWSEVDGADKYQLREGETEISPDDTLAHSVTNENGRYNYQVRACHTNGACTDWSRILRIYVFVSSSPPTLTLTETPDDTRSQDGTYNSTDGDYILNWTRVDGAAIYQLREGEMGLTFSADTDTTTTHSVIDKMNGSYSYQVRACHTNHACGNWSSSIRVNVFTESAPTLTLTSSDDTRTGTGTYSSTDGDYTLSWTMLDGASYRYQLQEASAGTDTFSPIDVSGTVEDKMNGSYTYRVRACHTNMGCTAWSNTLRVNVFIASAPTLTLTSSDETRAEDGTYSSSDGDYILSWVSVGGAATHELQEASAGTDMYSPIELDPVLSTTRNVDGKMNGSYIYRVRACHTNMACTAWSSIRVNVFASGTPANLRSDETRSGDGGLRFKLG